jgi:hypothetical protein
VPSVVTASPHALFSRASFSSTAVADEPDRGATSTPLRAFWEIIEFETTSVLSFVVSSLTPFRVSPDMARFSIRRPLPETNLTPSSPVPTPLMRRLRRITWAVGPAWTVMPSRPAASTEATWPPPPSIVIDLVIVKVP